MPSGAGWGWGSKTIGAGGKNLGPLFLPFFGRQPAVSWGSPAGKMSNVQHMVKDIVHDMIDVILGQPAGAAAPGNQRVTNG